MTNGAGSVIKLIQINNTEKPSGILWVQFDHADVGQKSRHENRQLYLNGIEPAWTPIKPVTSQFAVGRNKTVQVVRQQFPLRPAAAKTIYRSQGDTENRIVVNFETKRAIPHIHYVVSSRVTTIDGLYITDLCENKVAVSNEVQEEMHRLRTEGQLSLSITPIYKAPQIGLKFCFLNARSLHKHIKDVQNDFNYSCTDVNIFSETRFSSCDSDNLYLMNDKNYSLFRNDAQLRNNQNTRPYGGTAVYSRLDYYPGYPYSSNRNSIEITILRFIVIPHVTIVGVYRSPGISVQSMCGTIKETLESLATQYNILLGDFNINWLTDCQRTPLYNLFIRDRGYRQLVSCTTTDRNTCIDHIFTNLPESQIHFQILEDLFFRP